RGWLLRIAEVEVVGQRQRLRADGDKVAPRLRHRLLRAFVRARRAIALGAVDGEREPFRPVAETDDRGAAARPLNRVAEDQRVVLLENPALGREVRRAN